MANNYPQTRKKPTVLCKGTRRDGLPCQGTPNRGGDYCEKHKSPAGTGIKNPNFKHGKYARGWGESFARNFERFEHDPKVFEYWRRAAINEARLDDLLTEATSEPAEKEYCPECGSGLAVDQQAHRAFRELRAKIVASVKNPDVLAALERASDALDTAYRQEAAWDRVGEYLDRGTKMSEAFHRRMERENQQMPTDKVMALVTGMWRVIDATVQDEQLRAQIREEWGRVLAGPTPLLIEG